MKDLNFIESLNLEELVKVYKYEGVTKTIQLYLTKSMHVLIETSVYENRILSDDLGDYFDLRMYSEQPKGIFADTIILFKRVTEN